MTNSAPVDSDYRTFSLPEILTELEVLLADVERAEQDAAHVLARVLPEHRESARNLIHYVAVRQHDLRPLQESLADYGLSSLGRMEAIVRSWLLTVTETVRAMVEGRHRREIWGPLDDGQEVLDRNSQDLLGRPHGTFRQTRIMVTLPSEAAEQPELVSQMGRVGMDIARINCAHDDETAWASMVASVRSLPGEVRVAMDLGGPKLRTGPLVAGPKVTRVKPVRNQRGETISPSSILLVDAANETVDNVDGDIQIIPVTGLETSQFSEKAELKFRDARGRKRKLVVASVSDAGVLVRCDRTVYFETGLEITYNAHPILTVADLEPVRQHLFVRAGDVITLCNDMTPQPATEAGPHRIGCSLEAAFRDAQPGERILFDDGKIEGTIRAVDAETITVDVTRAGVDGVKLRAEKGINLPDTVLNIPALTEADRSHLPFVAANADAVNLSFVRSAADVADLITELEQLKARRLGITLKIETESGFRDLPRMLLEAMRWSNVGVMIARGDLAVELGFERMAEVQEEILWICEAAHVPVIWATQVLDSLARTGLPSRAEVTDAAMSRRAEAVMLNKGPFIVDAIDTLSSILDRMGGHVAKKRSLLRPLASFSLTHIDEDAARPQPSIVDHD